MKLFQNFIAAAYLSEAKKPIKESGNYIIKANGDRSVEVDEVWEVSDDINSKLPSEPCTFFGKHSYTGEDGFGQEFGYNLSYQGSNGGFNGFLKLDNYHDFMNCYVDVNANPECEAISITFTSVAVERCNIRSDGKTYPYCYCDRFWISNENTKFPRHCGCIGDGCNDVLWSRNVTHPITGEDDYYEYYYEDQFTNPDGSYNLTAIYDYSGPFEDLGLVDMNDREVVDKTGQIVLGNKFRFNFQSDYGLSHGEVRLDWECITDATTTAYTEWSTTTATTTSATTTTTEAFETGTTTGTTTPYTTTTESTTSTTTEPYTTSSGTTATLTEPYPSCHPGLAGPGCEQTTTHPGIPDGNYESISWDGNSCYRYPLGRETFKTRMENALSSAVANDKLSLSHNGRDTIGSAMRQKQFTEWLQNVFDRFYEDITEENPRKCLAEKFKDSLQQGESGLIASHFLSKDKLGSDCALDIEDGDIDNACWKLNDFFVWAYEDCGTEGSNLLLRLGTRCDRINEIRQEIADRE